MNIGNWRLRAQNLDYRPGDDQRSKATGSIFRHGRAWLRTDPRRAGQVLSASWNLRSSFCHTYIKFDGLHDMDVTVGVALPPVALWLTIGCLPKWFWRALGLEYVPKHPDPDHLYGTQRSIGVHVHDWLLRVEVWRRDMMWSSSDPWWMGGSVNLLDAFFGRTKMTEELVEEHAVIVPMPERGYRGTAKLYRRTWSRTMWPFKRGPRALFHEGLYCDLKMLDPIPFPGKGENSWDCGDDALYGMGCEGGADEAIGKAVASVLKSRNRYGGGRDWLPAEAAP